MEQLSEYQQFVLYKNYLKLNMPTCRLDYILDMPTEVMGKPVRQDVISFLSEMLYYNTESSTDIILLFRCGYCYHLAVILRDLFGGSIVVDKEAGHMYWKDENNLLYDIHGVSEISDKIRYIPLEEFKRDYPEEFKNYLHIDD